MTQPCDPTAHSPIPCCRPNPDSPCSSALVASQWRSHPRTHADSDHPLVQHLVSSGCHDLRARSLVSLEAYGMTSLDGLAWAYRVEAQLLRSADDAPSVCPQCRRCTTTFAYCGPYEPGQACRRVTVNLADLPATLGTPRTTGDEAGSAEGWPLCIGAGGALEYCAPGTFLAVSHVWEHGWKGSSEDGLCSRVLKLLLDVARRSFGLDYVWLDPALVSREPTRRSLAINAMRSIYSTAKATLVCDRRLVLLPEGCGDREMAVAIAGCDWMTRVWTMQEGLLSGDVAVLRRQGTAPSRPREIMASLILSDSTVGRAESGSVFGGVEDEESENEAWQAFGAVQTISSLLKPSPDQMLERVVLASRERLTTNAVDYARALFPLFDLRWPGPETTLEQGQIMLLQSLGSEAGRLTSLWGPVGLPEPFSWAPLTIPGTDGRFGGRGRTVTEHGLMGAWSWREVRPVRQVPFKYAEKLEVIRDHGNLGDLTRDMKSALMDGMRTRYRPMIEDKGGLVKAASSAAGSFLRSYKSHDRRWIESAGRFAMSFNHDFGRGIELNWRRYGVQDEIDHHGSKIALMTGNACEIIEFETDGEQESMMVYYSLKDPLPWPGKRVLLLAAGDRSNVDSPDLDFYTLASVDSAVDGWYHLHRIGSAMGRRIDMNEMAKSLQGVLS